MNMIIIDTNVVPELLQTNPDTATETWLGAKGARDIYLTAISEGELLYGVAVMPEGERQAVLGTAIEGILGEESEGRILPYGSNAAAAAAYAAIAARRRSAGRPIATADCQIAAIIYTRSATIETRNIPDFEDCQVNLINPWIAA